LASTLSDVAYLASYPPFVDQVKAAAVLAATQVGQETSDITTDYHRLRRALSVNVLQDPDAWAPRFAIAVATNSVVTKDSSDSDIQFTVNSVWSSIAGAGPAPA
jgi:hypothetical protein